MECMERMADTSLSRYLSITDVDELLANSEARKEKIREEAKEQQEALDREWQERSYSIKASHEERMREEEARANRLRALKQELNSNP